MALGLLVICLVRLNALLIILNLLFATNLLAAVLPNRSVATYQCRVSLENSISSQFDKDIRSAFNALKKIRIQSEDILDIEGSLSPGFAFATAILRVRTQAGRFAFKIYREANPLQEMASTLIIQNEFARLGLAPQIHGVMSPAHVAKLLQRFPKAQSFVENSDFSFGFLMDEIAITSHITVGGISNSKTLPPKAELEKRVLEIEAAFSELRILIPDDLQLVVDQKRHLYLLDFDLYSHFTDSGHVIAPFTNPMTSVQNYLDSTFHGNQNKRSFQKSTYRVRLIELRKVLGIQNP
jgi:hypothetical protein